MCYAICTAHAVIVGLYAVDTAYATDTADATVYGIGTVRAIGCSVIVEHSVDGEWGT